MKEFVFIEGFEPAKVSRDGTIISRYGKILKHYACNGEYARVKIKGKRLLVHRILAKTFIPNPNEYPMVNHIDGNKLNNSLDNLEWCTLDQNMKHAQRTGLLIRGTEVHTNRLDEVQVLTIRKCANDGLSRKNLASYFNVALSTIEAIVTRRNWKYL